MSRLNLASSLALSVFASEYRVTYFATFSALYFKVVGIPEVVGVGPQSVRALLEVLGRLASDDPHVARLPDVEQYDLLAEVPEQGELAAGRERHVVRRGDARVVLDMELPLRPVEPKDAGAADEAVEVWPVERHEHAEVLVGPRHA
jgi:hypothetical protein